MLPAVFINPELLALCAIKSLFDHEGGALVSMVLATASFCCSLASVGATATTNPEKPADVASASVMSLSARYSDRVGI